MQRRGASLETPDRPYVAQAVGGSSTQDTAIPDCDRMHRQSAGVWWIGSSAVLLLAAVLEVSDGRTVLLPGGIALPEACWTYRLFGMDCPACGLTRSFVHMAHGRIAAAWAVHPLGPFLFLCNLVQIALAACYYHHGPTPRMRGIVQWYVRLLIGFALLMVLVWLRTLIP